MQAYLGGSLILSSNLATLFMLSTKQALISPQYAQAKNFLNFLVLAFGLTILSLRHFSLFIFNLKPKKSGETRPFFAQFA